MNYFYLPCARHSSQLKLVREYANITCVSVSLCIRWTKKVLSCWKSVKKYYSHAVFNSVTSQKSYIFGFSHWHLQINGIRWQYLSYNFWNWLSHFYRLIKAVIYSKKYRPVCHFWVVSLLKEVWDIM